MAFPVLLAAVLSGATIEDVRLATAVREGDRLSVRTEVSLSLSSAGATARPAEEGGEGKKEGEEPKEEDAGATPKGTPWSLRFTHTEHFDETIEKVKDGVASETKREFRRAATRRRSKEGDAEPVEETKESPLHERTLVLRRDGDEVRVASGGERLDAERLALVRMDLPLHALLPRDRVEAGASWSAEGAPLDAWVRDAFAGVASSVGLPGPLRCTYRGTSVADGQTLDEIEVEATLPLSLVASPTKDGRAWIAASVDLKGKAHFDRAAGRFVRFAASGALESREAPSPDAEAKPVAVEGDLRLSIEIGEAREAGEGETLALRYKPGDVFTRTSTARFEMTLESLAVSLDGKPIDMGGEKPEMEIRTTSETKTVEEIVKVEGGKPTSVRIEILASRTKQVARQGADAEPEEEESGAETEGAVLLASRDGDEVEVKVESGTVPEKERGDFRPDDPTSYLLPDEPVVRGSAWSVEGKRLREFLHAFAPRPGDDSGDAIASFLESVDGSIDCRIAEFAETEGVRTARIAFRANLVFEPDGREIVKRMAGDEEIPEGAELPDIEFRIEADLTGELLFAVKEGRATTLQFQGPLKIRQSMSSSRGEHDFSQAIEFSGNLEASFGSVRGRPGK